MRRLVHATFLFVLIIVFSIPSQFTLAALPPALLTVDTATDSNAPAYQACTSADNDCSLRGAISRANAELAVVHSIVLPSGTYTLTVSGVQEDANATGDLDVTGGTLMITGAGSELTVMNGNALDRLLHVHTGAFVTLDGVTITGGKSPLVDIYPGADGTDGGGIHNAGTLVIRNTAVVSNATHIGSANMSPGDGGKGGGIYNSGSLRVSQSTLAYNSTGNGGYSTVDYIGGAGGSGAGVYSTGVADIASSDIISNTCGKGGWSTTGGVGGHGAGSTAPVS